MKKLWWMGLGPLFIAGAAYANYTATQGAGTSFASVVIGGTTHYFANLLCDVTAGQSQCANVNAAGQVGVTGPVTQSGTWTQRLQDGSGNSITSDLRGSTRPLAVEVLDASGNQVTTFGGASGAVATPPTLPTQATQIGVNVGGSFTVLSGTGTSMNVNMTNLNPNGATTPINAAPVVTAYSSTTGAIAPNTAPAGVNLKASQGQVTSIQLGNIGSGPAYLKLYNKATAPTCNTDTPVKRLIIPAAATAANGAGSNISFAAPINFSLGIGYCVTGGLPDTDTTALAANTVLVNIDWQ